MAEIQTYRLTEENHDRVLSYLDGKIRDKKICDWEKKDKEEREIILYTLHLNGSNKYQLNKGGTIKLFRTEIVFEGNSNIRKDLEMIIKDGLINRLVKVMENIWYNKIILEK